MCYRCGHIHVAAQFQATYPVEVCTLFSTLFFRKLFQNKRNQKRPCSSFSHLSIIYSMLIKSKTAKVNKNGGLYSHGHSLPLSEKIRIAQVYENLAQAATMQIRLQSWRGWNW